MAILFVLYNFVVKYTGYYTQIVCHPSRFRKN